jgi:hypothetical protein
MRLRNGPHPALGVLLWFAGVGLAFAVSYSLVDRTVVFGDAPADVLRHTGLFLQLWGLLLVAKEIKDLRARFGGPPSAISHLRTGLRRLWNRIRGRTPITATASVVLPAISGGGTVAASGYKAPETLEERVALLERLLEHQRGRVDSLRKRLDNEVGERKSADADALRDRLHADRELEALLQELAVGGLLLESVGWYWLLLGLLLSSWPVELATLLHFTLH